MSLVNDSQVYQLTRYLNDLEVSLRELGLWSEERPHQDALLSAMPFCCDTLEIEQWLQFIFIGRMRELLEQGDKLPTTCNISPYIEGLSAVGKSFHPLLAETIIKIDKIIDENGSGERI